MICSDVAEHGETVADLVGDELPVLRAHARVLVVVVELPRLDVIGQRLRDDGAVGPVALDQVLDVVRDHRREPARLLAAVLDRPDVARRADDALELCGIAARLLGRRARGAHDPLDDLGVGELDDHAVAEASCDRERLRPVSGDPHRDLGQLRPHPLQLEVLVVPLDLLSVHEWLDHREPALELRDAHRLLPDVPPRGVAAADAHHHAAVRDVVHRRVEAREDGGLPGPRVRDQVPELHRRGGLDRHRQLHERLLPEDVRVVRPADLEAVPLAELHELDEPARRRVGQDGDAERE